jgi:hypothetical protein
MPRPLNLIHWRGEIFRVLRRNIRGQHINFYSRVIHKAKSSIKSVLLLLAAFAERGLADRAADERGGQSGFPAANFSSAKTRRRFVG